MSLLLHDHERINPIIITATMAILTAVTTSAYSINIEYRFDPEDNEITMDEVKFETVSIIQEIKNISYDEKNYFLTDNLESFDNQHDRQYKNNYQEAEKESLLSIPEKDTVSDSDFQSAKKAYELFRKKDKFTDNIFVVNQNRVTGE